MHNDFETLKRQCRSYRLKRLMRKLTPLLLLLGAGFAVVYYYHFTPSNSNTGLTAGTMATVEKPQLPLKVTPSQPPVTEYNNTQKTTVSIVQETPSNRPIHNKDVSYEIHVDADYLPEHPVAAPQKATATPPRPTAPQPEPVVQTAATSQSQEKPRQPLSMSVKQIDSIETMQQLYENEPSYAQALSIARHYYHIQRYSQAALWAKKANILERKRDGAWILYAKAEYAKGNRHRAIEILKLYLANARSDEGNSLLRSWTQGE